MIGLYPTQAALLKAIADRARARRRPTSASYPVFRSTVRASGRKRAAELLARRQVKGLGVSKPSVSARETGSFKTRKGKWKRGNAGRFVGGG